MGSVMSHQRKPLSVLPQRGFFDPAPLFLTLELITAILPSGLKVTGGPVYSSYGT